MKRLILTIIIVALLMPLAGCTIVSHHGRHGHGPGHGAVIVTGPPHIPSPPRYPHGHRQGSRHR
ncbi:MAG: hypothetical protein ACYSWW_16405 [Planctomycetota bacterium]